MTVLGISEGPDLRIRSPDHPMLSILETPVAPAKKTGKRAAPQAAPSTGEPNALPKKEIRTLLVASCGWPTDAALPARRRPAKR